MIPHKSKKKHSNTQPILHHQAGGAVNDTTTNTVPLGTMYQMGHVLDHIIYTYAEAKEGKNIFTAKEDVQVGFWRCSAEEGQEWNFAYLLTQAEGEPMKLDIPTSLQIRWIESPGYFSWQQKQARIWARSMPKPK